MVSNVTRFGVNLRTVEPLGAIDRLIVGRSAAVKQNFPSARSDLCELFDIGREPVTRSTVGLALPEHGKPLHREARRRLSCHARESGNPRPIGWTGSPPAK